MTDSIPTKTTPPAGAPHTVAEALGQVVWLLSQSPLHRELKLKDLEWSFMPAIVKEQFRIFRFGPLAALDAVDADTFQRMGMSREGLEQLPLGVAIWANLSEAAEAKLEQGEHLALEDWQSGDRLWLVEFVAPFAGDNNKIAEAMMFDLMQGPFRGKTFHLHRTDPATGRRDKIKLNGAPVENRA
jgi:cytolysin-activating lysine-acyltransferase